MFLNDQQQRRRLPMSPAGSDVSASDGSQWLSSGASSPAPSDHQHSSVWSACGSFGPPSVASSLGAYEQQQQQQAGNSLQSNGIMTNSSNSSRSSSSSSSSKSSRSSSSYTSSPSRRLRNATAAEQYRKRQKGRKCSLEEQMELELERNLELRRQMEAKLALYREFVAHLAKQTRANDHDLAQVGCKSLTSVLHAICSSASSSSLPVGQHSVGELVQVQHELETHLNHFQAVLQQQQQQQQSTSSHFLPVAASCSQQSARPKVNSTGRQQVQQAADGQQKHQHRPRPEFYHHQQQQQQPANAVGQNNTNTNNNHYQQLEYDFYADRFVSLIGA